jgi:hypothetical protein
MSNRVGREGNNTPILKLKLSGEALTWLSEAGEIVLEQHGDKNGGPTSASAC